ncbi:MAG: GMC family oxidoreductase [Nitrospirales bacterium]|nr:GMC family oxidoreductase [Nitrospirales bacterium]
MKPMREQMRRYSGPVDVCVVGAGAGGAVVAKELAEAGLSVVIIEAGPWLDTQKDFINDELVMLDGRMDWDGLRITAGKTPLSLGRKNTGRAVGGSTVHYTAVTLRLHAEDFKLRTREGIAEDWPLAYRELEPYYEKVERYLAVSGPRFFPWPPFHGPYPHPELPWSARDHLLAEGMLKMGLTPVKAPHAIITGSKKGRSPCMMYGFCANGCKSDAKSSTLVTYIPDAVRAGAEIRERCFAVRVNTDARRLARSVTYLSEGKEEEQEAKVIVLASYAVETPRLLLNSANGAFPDGLANSSGQVGRNLMVHLGDNVIGRFPRPVDNWVTPPVGVMSQDHYGTHPHRDFVRGYTLQAYHMFPIEFFTTLVEANPFLWGKRLMEVVDHYDQYTILGTVGEVLPNGNNSVTLADEKDSYGIPVAKVTYSHDGNSLRMSEYSMQLCEQVLQAAGASHTICMPGTIHLLGTCRMGNDPVNSVVDKWGCTHDISNLFICDGSVFVTGGAVNPSLTIQALATRTAEHIIRTGKKRPSPRSGW